jgi:hypothetical protein
MYVCGCVCVCICTCVCEYIIVTSVSVSYLSLDEFMLSSVVIIDAIVDLNCNFKL